MLFRKAELGAVDMAARSVPVVICTDAPVERQGFTEVLDMARCDLSRGDLPLIESHDANRLNIGVVREIRIDGNKLRGVAVFGLSARSEEVLADVQAGIVRGVSVGYQLTDEGTPTVTHDGRNVRSFGFLPYEVSAVAVPADTQAGFNRSHKTLSLPKQAQKKIMNSNTQENFKRNDAQEIACIGAMTRGGDALALKAIQEGRSIEQFREEMMLHLTRNNVHVGDLDGPVVTEARSGVTLPMMRSRADFERHYQTSQNREHIGMTDFLRGLARMKTTSAVTRALSIGVDTSGGYMVPTVLMPGLLDALVPNSSVLQAGASIVPLMDGAKSYNFAGVDTIPTAAWRLESGAVAESAPTFKNVVMTPRSLSFRFKVSRELLADAPNSEAAFLQIAAQAIAKGIDRAALLGSGSAPEPRGLANVAGIQSVTNGAAGTVLGSYANLFSASQAILQADGPMPKSAIMSPRSLVKLGGLTDTTGQPLRTPIMLEKMQFLSTSQISNTLTVGGSSDCSQIFVGDFSKFVVGMREQFTVQILDELYAETGEVGFVMHARLDFACLYPQAFALVTGVR